MFRYLIASCWLLLIACVSPAVQADVVKPALVEISVNTNGSVQVDIRASIEAWLTGINAQYKNTKEAPTADKYDALRVLPPEELRERFKLFETELLELLRLTSNDQPLPLEIESISIPEPGYTKVPRISTILLRTDLDRSNTEIRWYYPARLGDNAVRVRQVDEANEKWHWSEWQWIRNDETSKAFSLQELFTQSPIHEVIISYIKVGFEHIVPKGSDHILFVLGIFLFSVHLRPLLWQVTMFTVAHTITLGLSMNGIIDLPARFVEPMIALSIAYIGIENIFAHTLNRHRLVLVFTFGLLHGLGFASMLADFGMPDDAFATALISFNIGVELGQLAVIGVALLLFGYWFRDRSWYRQRIVIPGSLLITLIGLWWTIERLEFI